ncbi:MAG: rhodanese-like domain-containing protein [Sphingorhabdus sp.]
MSHLKVTFGAILALTLASCGNEAPVADAGGAAQEASAITLVSVNDASKLLAEDKDAILIDVRTPEEFGSGHLAGADNVDFKAADFIEKISQLDKSKHYVVYCGSGKRSGKATAKMEELGFAKITDVDGGITAWNAAKLPVVEQ